MGDLKAIKKMSKLGGMLLVCFMAVGCSKSGSDSIFPRNINDFMTLATGHKHACGLSKQGEAYCWQKVDEEPDKSNDGLQKGSSDRAVKAGRFFQVARGDRDQSEIFIDINAADHLFCGITNSSRMYCWNTPRSDKGLINMVSNWDQEFVASLFPKQVGEPNQDESETDNDQNPEVDPMGSFHGNLYEKDSNNSVGPKIPGVTIYLQSESGDYSTTATTDEEGYYEAFVPEGRYIVTAEKPGFIGFGSAPDFFVKSGLEAQQANIFLEEELAQTDELDCSAFSEEAINEAVSSFIGHAYGVNLQVGSDLTNLEAAVVTFREKSGCLTKSVSTFANGYYEIKLPPGKYYVSAEKEGYKKYGDPPPFFELGQENLVRNVFLNEVLANGAVAGGVFDWDSNLAHGDLLPNVRVIFSPTLGGPDIEAVTDNTGRYRAFIPSGDYLLGVEINGVLQCNSFPTSFAKNGAEDEIRNIFLEGTCSP